METATALKARKASIGKPSNATQWIYDLICKNVNSTPSNVAA
jgi:hypothetical protein